MAISEEVKRQIGQHFVFGFEGYEPNEHITKLIRDYYVGNVIIFRRNIRSIPQLHNLIQRLQQLAKDSGHTQPLLIGIDQENGLVSAFSSTSKTEAGTQFPGAMAVGSTGDPENARKVSNSSGREMHLAGINWAYSPVADVNSDTRNPVIGVRSYGGGMLSKSQSLFRLRSEYSQDAKAVSSFVRALSDGYVSAGIASCAKHFPGHGDTHVDSHLALPVVTKDLATLEQTELVPFQDAIANGIPSIMTGHIALPPLIKALGADKDERVPASLSRGIVTTLLREKMGFKGVVVTDCFEMNAISKGYGIGPGAVLALQADTDIVMCCHVFENQVTAVETAYTAVERGDLGPDFLRRSGERIAAMKEKFCGKWEDILGKPLDTNALSNLKKDNERISREIYARTSKWLSRPTDDKLLYISPHSDVLVLTPQMESINAAVDDPQDILRSEEGRIRNTAGPSYLAFATAIARRAPFSSHIVYTPLEAVEGGTLSSTLLQSILSVHAIVFATRNAHQSAWQLAVLRRVVDVIGKAAGGGEEQPIKIIVVASCAPYDHAFLQADEATKALPCLCTYEFTKPALEEAATKLYGEKFVE